MNSISLSSWFCLAWVFMAGSDIKGQSSSEASLKPSIQRESSLKEPRESALGLPDDAPISASNLIQKEEAEAMAAQLGILTTEVEPLWIKVNRFRDTLTTDLSTSSGLDSVKKTSDLIQQLSMTEQFSQLTETMIQFIQAVNADGAGDMLFRSGFMKLDAKKLEFQLMLFVAVEEMARRRLDLLGRLLHQRSSSAAVSPADFIIYAAVFSGIQDHSDFHRSGSEATPVPEHPHASAFLKLSASPNSIYQLLSIQLAPRFEPDEVKLEAIYAGFSREDDPYVKEAARKRVEASSSPNKAEILRRFESP